jgi:hypothetical protein
MRTCGGVELQFDHYLRHYQMDRVVSFTPGRLILGRGPHDSLNAKLGGPQRPSGCCGEEKSLSSSLNRNPVVQTVALQTEVSSLTVNRTFGLFFFVLFPLLKLSRWPHVLSLASKSLTQEELHYCKSTSVSCPIKSQSCTDWI